jgi:peroxiredoxin
MLALWIVVIVLGVLVLFETMLLMLLLRALGQIKQQGRLAGSQKQSPADWGLAIGEKAPSFVATDQDGHPVSLEDMLGRRCILAFISLGCVSCVTTVETLDMFLQEEPDIAIWVIGSTHAQQNLAYAAEHHTHLPILTPATSIDDSYNIQVKPFVFVLDEAGIVRAKSGMNDRQHLDTLLRRAFPKHIVHRSALPLNN